MIDEKIKKIEELIKKVKNYAVEGYNELKIGVVIDLKSTQKIEKEHVIQVKRYIQELKKQLKENEEVYSIGFIFDFTAPGKKEVNKNKVEEIGGVQFFEVK